MTSVDQLTLNGQSQISINAGTAPGAVRIRVDLYEDNSGVMGDAVDDIPSEEKNIVTVITGPPAQGVINYSSFDIAALTGGTYQMPVTALLWDIHSNPVNDSTSVYFDIRGITDSYDATKTYVNEDIIYWGTAPGERNETPDSLVYRCLNPVHGVCQLSASGAITGIPDSFVNNPPDNALEVGECNALDPSNDATCNENLNSIDCIAETGFASCINIGDNPECINATSEVQCQTAINNGWDCELVTSLVCNWQETFDFYDWSNDSLITFNDVWIPQQHPATILGDKKTGNLDLENNSYPGMANTLIYYGSSDLLEEAVIRVHTLGAYGESLVIDSRSSQQGENLYLPITEDGNITVFPGNMSANFSGITELGADGIAGDPPGIATDDDDIPWTCGNSPLEFQVTASISDYFQADIFNAELQIFPNGASEIVSVCDGIDTDGDGITGTCTDGDSNSLPYSRCSYCGSAGGIWAPDLGDQTGVGITNPSGQVTWVIRYDCGINDCDNCDTAQNPSCEDFESNVLVQHLNDTQIVSYPLVITISQTVACD